MRGIVGIRIFVRRMSARLIQIGVLFREIAAGFIADDCLLMAAAIAFFALLSTIPLLLLGTSALGFFLGSSEEAFGQIVMAFKRFFPRATVREIEGILRPLVEKKAIAGGLGLTFLLWGAIAVFETIQGALNTILGKARTRSFFRRQVGAFLMMLGAGILLLLTLGISWGVLALQALDLSLAGRWPFRMTPLWDLLLFLIPMLLTILLFTFLYMLAPARSVPLKEALIGGLVAGTLWQIAKLAFNWYLFRFAEWYNNIYGVLGGFIVLLLWILYNSLLLLLGAEVIKALQKKQA